jgi:competence protein ComEC
MLQITFKNVGQGDSIILEWGINESDRHIGIIDCNLLPDRTNPVLDYLRKSGYTEIEFIILSHPHFDHYSGLRKLLEFCEENSIVVKLFLHTSMQIPEYLQTAAKSSLANNELASLFLKVRQLYRSNIIYFHGYINNNSREIELTETIKLKFLSPSTIECDNYIQNVPLFHEEDGHNNPNANWLSTFIKVYSADWFILLTSDIDKSVLLRVGTRASNELKTKLLLGQSPHHGAIGNHRNSFWKTGIKERSDNTPIVISVGENVYNHPSPQTVDFFKGHNFSVFSTNQTGYLNTSIGVLSKEISALLDTSSDHMRTGRYNKCLNGDQKFIITNNELTYCV